MDSLRSLPVTRISHAMIIYVGDIPRISPKRYPWKDIPGISLLIPGQQRCRPRAKYSWSAEAFLVDLYWIKIIKVYNKLQFHQEQTSTGSESISAAKTHHNTFISSMEVLMCEPCCTKTYNRSPSATDAKDRRHSGKSQIEPSSRPQNRLHVASSNDGSENEQETTRQQVILDAHLGFHSPNEKILKESKSMGASGPSMNQNYLGNRAENVDYRIFENSEVDGLAVDAIGTKIVERKSRLRVQNSEKNYTPEEERWQRAVDISWLRRSGNDVLWVRRKEGMGGREY